MISKLYYFGPSNTFRQDPPLATSNLVNRKSTHVTCWRWHSFP